MSSLCWNCLGEQLVFLSETRVKDVKMERLRRRIGLKGCLAVSSNGMSGGLALFWHESLEVELAARHGGEIY